MTLVPWANLDDLPGRPTLPGGDEQWLLLLAASSEVLFALTGRRFAGRRERAVELYGPCRCGFWTRDPSYVPGVGYYEGPGYYPGAASSAVVPAFVGALSGCASRTVRLPNRNVAELLAVHRDDEVIPPARYRIDRGGYLRRARHEHTDEAPLPTCRHPLRLRYSHGSDPGPAGRAHAAYLALALGQAQLDPDSSPLPGTVTQIARQGVTFTQQAASALIEKGMTGLAGVDLWIASANPARLRRPARSWSPDTDARFYPLPIEEVP